ncbi:MAG: T9SS type A sorting domain-containing protein [Bacteroides intestinalis]|nr:T9SS type A sorting domain-containing protein [Bacteroides intestinalis]
MDAQIRYAHPFHINADEPDALKIGGKPQEDNMYRCSDHNPIVTFIKLGTTTGIENPTLSRPDIQLTGDPCNGYLTLVSNTDFVLTRAEIVNISGQVIVAYDTSNTRNTENHFTLPVKSLVRGFYLVRAYDAQGKCTTCKVVLP